VIGLVSELKDKLDRALTTAVLGAIAAAAAVAAFFFVCVAIFVSTADRYDTVTACAVLAVLFVVVAAAAATAVALVRRRAAERQRRASRKPQFWLDPAVMAAGLEVAKALGPRRIASLAVLGALVAGILLNRPPAGH
jgi:xanthine/uracil permease